MARTASGGPGALTSEEREIGTGNTLFLTWEASSGETSSRKTPPRKIISASPKILPTWGPPVTQTVLTLIPFVRNLQITIQKTWSEVIIINTCFERRHSLQFEIYHITKSNLHILATFLQNTLLFYSNMQTKFFFVGGALFC